MNLEYVTLQPLIGSTVREAVTQLYNYMDQNNGLAKLMFNGVWLYSDTVSLDNAYFSITSMRYKDFIKMEVKRNGNRS